MDGYSRAISSLSDLILEQTSDALIYANREGVIERWNQAAESMFGYTFAEAYSQSLDLIIPEHLRPAHWRGFEAAMVNGSTRLHGRPTLTRAERRSGENLCRNELCSGNRRIRKGHWFGCHGTRRDRTCSSGKDAAISKNK